MKHNELNGTYRGKVIDGGLAKTSKGNEQVALLCELTGEEVRGMTLTYYGFFTDKTIDQTIKALRAAGWNGTDLSEIDDWKKAVPTPPEVDFVIEQEDAVDSNNNVIYDENNEVVTRARVRWINAVGGLGVKERMSSDESKSFAARMKGKLLAFDQNNRGPKNNGAPQRPASAPQQRPSPPPPANTGTDDIPF